MSKKLKLLIGILVSILFLYLSLKGLNYQQIKEIIPNANLKWLGVAAFFHFLSVVLRGVRWRYILKPVKDDMSFLSLYGSLNIGLLGNNVLPARLGEVVRAIVLNMKEKIPKSSALSSVVLERFFDGSTTVTLAILSIFLVPAVPRGFKKTTLLIGIFFVSIFVFYYLAHIWKNPIKKFLKRIRNKLPEKWQHPAYQTFKGLIDGLRVLKTPNILFLTILSTFAVWFVDGLSYYTTFLAFKIETNFAMIAFTMVAVNLGVTIPSGPGYMGVFEYACILALSLFGIGKEYGLFYGISAHAIRYIVQSSVGLFFLWRWGFSLTKLSKIKEENPA